MAWRWLVWTAVLGLTACEARAVPADASVADAGSGRCDPLGRWLITWDGDFMRCGPGTQLSFELSQDDIDAGAAEPSVVFPDRGLRASSCGGPKGQSSYELTSHRLDGGCRFALGYASKWCANGEPQCEVQELEVSIGADRAEVTGRYRKCWCDSSPIAPYTWKEVTGKAVRIP